MEEVEYLARTIPLKDSSSGNSLPTSSDSEESSSPALDPIAENSEQLLNSGLRRRAHASAAAAPGAAAAAPAASAGAGNGDPGKGEPDASSGSVGKSEESGGEKGKKRVRRTVSTPVHTHLRESPLSSDAIFKQSHGGLVNLCIVVLVAVNSRLIIENLLKYGILIRANFWFAVNAWRDWPLAVCGLSLAWFPMAALLIEWLHLHANPPDRVVVLLHVLNIAVEFFYPAIVICSLGEVQPLGGFLVMFVAVIIMMKLISFAHVNHDLRRRIQQGEIVEESVPGEESATYPENLTVGSMLYFLAAPTLCYQLAYPRTPEIRKAFLFRQVALLLSFLCLMMIIIDQYITPIIQNSKHPFQGHLVESVERVLRLSIPTLYVWLCSFFVFFHLWLNVLAELLRFGDRDFYRDWWNAKTIEEYWRSWNMPVHRWMARHIYFPCINKGCPRSLAMFLVFFLSAVFHEVLIGIPCRMFRLWAFSGMAFQIPLVFLTNYLYHKYKNPIVGNMLFWFFFCIVGQPACVLLYYHDVQLQMTK